LAAATAISNRSFTFGWPVKSEKSDGRSVISSAASGWFKVETVCSAIASSMGNAPRSSKRDSSGGVPDPGLPVPIFHQKMLENQTIFRQATHHLW
jgi:hypothetical protein